MNSAPPTKVQVFDHLLQNEALVFMALDSRLDGVTLPEGLMGQERVILQFGLNLPVPINDLVMDESGWCATLSFGRQPFYCTAPWNAVYVIASEEGRGMEWPHDVPQELAEPTSPYPRGKTPGAPPQEKAKRKMPPGWGIYEGGKKD